ncbi:hypothetical protein PF011_g31021, partial [Phytophthora fragariae]
EGTALTSGRIALSTGGAQVSGLTSLSTGVSVAGNSGAVNIVTSGATKGAAGDIDLQVGSGDSNAGGNVFGDINVADRNDVSVGGREARGRVERTAMSGSMSVASAKPGSGKASGGMSSGAGGSIIVRVGSGDAAVEGDVQIGGSTSVSQQVT